MVFDLKPNTVIHGDCLTVLRQMEANSVDMVITDPPYGVDYQSTRTAKENRREKISNDKAPFIWWIYDAYRVLKEGGSTVFQPLGCSAGFYGRTKDRRVCGQVRTGMGQVASRHG